MVPLKPLFSILQPRKSLDKCFAELIAKELLNIIENFEIPINQLLIF